MSSEGFAASLPDVCPELWEEATRHRLVRAIGDGSLPADAFACFIQQDFVFLTGLRDVIREIAAMAPDETRAGLNSVAIALGPELDLFRSFAEQSGISVGVEPTGACLDCLTFLRKSVAKSYAHGLCALFANERCLLDSWKFAAELVDDAAPYAEWLEGWSSSEYGMFVDWLGSCLDAAASDDLDPLRDTFTHAIRLATAFWDECSA
jgi:thiaminase/transcriptional activator TenA